MKKYISNLILSGIMLLSLLLSSCSNILTEHPRSLMTPDLFKTNSGLQTGLTAAYSGLRYISGTEPTMYSTVLGTDEFTAAASCSNNDLDMTNGIGNPINSSTGSLNVFWNYPFSYVNTCNGIIQFGTAAGLDKGLLAEAHFLRAYYYFMMVRMFGAVPLDLGSGRLQFNTTPTTTSARDSVSTVYSAIESDLQYAVTNLPVSARLPGCPFQATALHYLAKVYLTEGKYQLALTTAQTLINNQATYKVALLPTYAAVIQPGNEHNSEVLFTCEHTENYTFNETPIGMASGGATNKDDRSCSYFTPNYPTWTVGSASPVQRSTLYQRPWIRLAPTYDLTTRVFADKTNDSRYYATFQSVWLDNTKTVTGLLGNPINVGDTAFYFPGYEVSAAFRASKNYRIWTPSQFDRNTFPTCQKFADPNRGDMNDASGRPFILAKLSETYLIAAEAALDLEDNTDARNYILVLRTRAATPGNVNAMIAATPAIITMDYLLDERSRELCGEGMRWFDLVRTGKWISRSQNYSINGTTNYVRNIQSYYNLRPIPQSQINLMSNSAADKASYQNPGYN